MKLTKRKLTHIIFSLFMLMILSFSIVSFFSRSTLSDINYVKWDGKEVATSFAGGNGTKENPYKINNGGQLMYFKKMVEEENNFLDKYYVLGANIDLDDHEITPIGTDTKYFSGSLDGKGYTITNINIKEGKEDNQINYYGLFNKIKGTINNLNIDEITINPESEDPVIIGSLAGKIEEESSIKNISIHKSNIYLTNTTNDKSNNIALFSGIIEEKSTITNISVFGKFYSPYSDNVSIISNKLDSNIKNAIMKVEYEDGINDLATFGNIGDEVETTNIFNFINKDRIVIKNETYTASEVVNVFNDEILDNYYWDYDEDFSIYVRDNKIDNTPKVRSFSFTPSGTIALHDSGVSTADKTVYINDLTSDYNYYMGLNYTTTSNGNVPTGSSNNTYTDSNLVAVYMAYRGESINDDGKIGYVSLNEQISDFIYYKYYVIENGYITIPLIDNPYADRPNDMAFNGWITDYPNAVVSYDADTYTRYVKIPATTGPISITMYATWTEATVVNASVSSNNLSTTGLKPISMQPIITRTPNYNGYTFPTLYTRGSVTSEANRNGAVPYPAGAVDDRGNSLSNSMCEPIVTGSGWNRRYSSQTCYYYMQADTTNIDPNESYYQIGNNGSMTSYTLPTPTGYDYERVIDVGDSVAGFYKRHTEAGSLVGYYNNRGVQYTSGSCSSNCEYYELVQFDENNVMQETDSETLYYYLVTRDTNIAFLNSNIQGFTNSVPVTVTGINNGVDHSNYEIQVNTRSIRAGADLRVEWALVNRNSYSTNTSGPSDSNTNNIYGEYHNLKIGRGIEIETTTTTEWQYIDGRYQQVQVTRKYLTATSVVGGSSSAAGGSGSPEKYNLIVESGYYNVLSAVSTTSSSSTYYTNAVATYGCDFDRVNNADNSKLGVYYTAASSWGGSIYSSSSSTDTELFSTQIVKSGTFGEVESEAASGIYAGGLNGGTIYAPARLIIEGGDLFNVNGGPLISSNRKTKNMIYINMKGGNADFIFGGAALSQTYGNRIINVTGGQVNYSVFGGSNGVEGGNGDGTLDGDSFVYVGGNAKIGDDSITDTKWGVESGSVFGIGNGNSSYDTIGSTNNSNVIIAGSATIKTNVYGGGNYGAVGVKGNTSTTTTNVKIIGGDVKGSVYGGGNNAGSGTSSYTSTVNITMDGGTVEKNVFGGSRTKGIIYGSTNVNINQGVVEKDVYGGGEGGYEDSNTPGTYVARDVNVVIGDTNTTTSNLTIKGSVYGGSAYGSVNGSSNNASATATYKTNVTVNGGKIETNVYGGGKGDSTHTPKEFGDVTVTIEGGSIGDVYGGNDQAGSPQRGDVVNLNGGTIANGFGGGNNTGQTTTNINLAGTTVTGNLYGGSNNGGIVTTSNVHVTSGSVTNVYGGNNLNGSTTTTNVIIDGGTFSGDVYGGGNQANSSTSNVTINASTNHNVYGGGNQAGVTTQTNVNINAGTIVDVFGGSNSSGEINNTHVIVSGTGAKNIQNVYGGNNLGGTTDNAISVIEVSSGTIGNIYGGGNKVGLDTSNVTVTGGTITSVYGGSNTSGDLNESNVTIGSTTSQVTVQDVYGGNNLGGVTDDANIVVTNATVNNLYGGGNQAAVGSTHVEVVDSTIQNIYGGGNQAGVTGNTYLDVDNSTVSTNIYGGGNQGAVGGNTEVYITDGTIGGSCYAGGNGSTAIVSGNTLITVDGDTVVGSASSTGTEGSVFGGGNAAATGSSSTNNSVATVNIVGGHIYGNVYGGANTSVVYGETHTNIGTNAVNVSGLDEADLIIEGTVFGGGEANASGSDSYDFSFISVTRGIDVNIDGLNYLTHGNRFELNGSIFGSGNASSSAGTSEVYIRNLGTRTNPSSNVSIQRADKVVIDNSVIELSGTVDTTNDYSNIKYSLNRIEDFIIKNNTVLLLKENANLLQSFRSMVGTDGNEVLATVNINDDTQTVTKNVDNRLYMLADKNLNVATNQDATAYGEVKGMTFLGMYTMGTTGSRRYGVYSDTFDYGSASDAGDMIIGGTSVKGSHLVNHDITKDGFYSNYLDEENNYSEVRVAYVEPQPPASNFYIWSIGEETISYEFTMTASKYGSLGTYTLSMSEFADGNTIFNVSGFNTEGLASGVSLIDSDTVPKIAHTQAEANSVFGLSMKAETREWTSYGTTKLLSRDNGDTTGTDSYKTDSQSIAPTMMFYFYHAKNIALTAELGTAVLTLQAMVPINEIEYDIQLITITINLEAQEYDDEDAYDASISYDKKYEMPSATPVNITNRSQFTAYYSMIAMPESFSAFYGRDGDYYHALVTDAALPVGTEITMIDNSIEGHPEEYYLTIDQARYNASTAQLSADSEISYKLSEFIKMDSTSTTNKYSDVQMNQVYFDDDYNLVMEEFLFIFDFKNTTVSDGVLNKYMLFELRNGEDRTMYHVVTPRRQFMYYNTYAASNSVLVGSITPERYLYQDIDSTTPISAEVDYDETSGRESIIDTNYESSSMGLNLAILDHSGNQVSSSMLIGTSVTINNTEYYADSDGVFRIKLAGKVSNINGTMTLKTDKSLPVGEYTFRFTLFASNDGLHNSDPDRATVYNRTVTVVGSNNSIVVTGDDKNKVVDGVTSLNELGAKYNNYSIKYVSALSNPNFRVSLYKRDITDSVTTNYTEVPFNSLFTDTLTDATGGTAYEKIVPTGTSPFNVRYNFADNLTSGTYKIVFKLYDGNQLVDSDNEFIIVKKRTP
ncbi:MAG: hypothetical protein IJI43_03455 [Bacilli bacterium]|nr:hypothetical protein [Bacilli bacterium]